MLNHVHDPFGNRVLTVAEAAKLTSLSVPTLRRKQRDGSGPCVVRLGERRIGYRLADLNAWLESRARGGEPG